MEYFTITHGKIHGIEYRAQPYNCWFEPEDFSWRDRIAHLSEIFLTQQDGKFYREELSWWDDVDILDGGSSLGGTETKLTGRTFLTEQELEDQENSWCWPDCVDGTNISGQSW